MMPFKSMQGSHYDTLYRFEETHWWYRVRRQIVGKLLSTFSHGKPVSILDIGCGTGLLMQEMQQLGRVEGIDISQHSITYCESRGLRPKVASAESLPFPSKQFDAVVMLDVLEHLDDPHKGAQEVFRVLKENGRAIITVPAFMFLWSITDVISHHKKRYTKPELLEILRSAGLKIEYVTYFNTFLFPLIAAVRFMVRLFHIPMHSENTVGGPRTNSVLYRIFELEKALIPHISLPFGVSILAIVSPKNHESRT